MVVRLGRDASAWWQAHGAQVTHRGTLVLAMSRDRLELDRFARMTDAHRAVGADDIAALEPDLGGRIPRGLFYETEGHLNPVRRWPRCAIACPRSRPTARPAG